jgi:signal transduction histidine kinase
MKPCQWGVSRRPCRSRPADDEGLGLSIVAAIAKAHRAALAINPGTRGGLDIEIRFPAATATVPARPKALVAT